MEFKRMQFEKRKPKYCPKHGRKLFLYWCFSCKCFHKPFKILTDVGIKA